MSAKKAPLFRITWPAATLLVLFFITATCAVFKFPFFVNADLAVANWVNTIRTPELTSFMGSITRLGGTIQVITVTAVATLACVVRKRIPEGFFIFLSVAVISAFTQFFKLTIAYPRPSHTHVIVPIVGHSFPSGHTAAAFAWIGAVALVVASQITSKPLRNLVYAIAVLLIAIVSVSRVYLGAHWISDVIGALFLAGALLITFYDTYRRGLFRLPRAAK